MSVCLICWTNIKLLAGRVYQLALLEHEQRSTDGTPQGVILALVGAEPPEGGSEKDGKESHRTVRMYNLSSLASITRWATARQVRVFTLRQGVGMNECCRTMSH